jgi:hypothetical protein
MKVESNGLTINVEETGKGDLSLVFLHYWGGSSRTWKHVTAKLVDRFRIPNPIVGQVMQPYRAYRTKYAPRAAG